MGGKPLAPQRARAKREIYSFANLANLGNAAFASWIPGAQICVPGFVFESAPT